MYFKAFVDRCAKSFADELDLSRIVVLNAAVELYLVTGTACKDHE